jgi:hypothetical protein
MDSPQTERFQFRQDYQSAKEGNLVSGISDVKSNGYSEAKKY